MEKDPNSFLLKSPEYTKPKTRDELVKRINKEKTYKIIFKFFCLIPMLIMNITIFFNSKNNSFLY